MNASLYSLDRFTHFKIIAVAAIAAAVVLAVGKTAQLGSAAPSAAVSSPYESPSTSARLLPRPPVSQPESHGLVSV